MGEISNLLDLGKATGTAQEKKPLGVNERAMIAIAVQLESILKQLRQGGNEQRKSLDAAVRKAGDSVMDALKNLPASTQDAPTIQFPDIPAPQVTVSVEPLDTGLVRDMLQPNRQILGQMIALTKACEGVVSAMQKPSPSRDYRLTVKRNKYGDIETIDAKAL